MHPLPVQRSINLPPFGKLLSARAARSSVSGLGTRHPLPQNIRSPIKSHSPIIYCSGSRLTRLVNASPSFFSLSGLICSYFFRIKSFSESSSAQVIICSASNTGFSEISESIPEAYFLYSYKVILLFMRCRFRLFRKIHREYPKIPEGICREAPP